MLYAFALLSSLVCCLLSCIILLFFCLSDVLLLFGQTRWDIRWPPQRLRGRSVFILRCCACGACRGTGLHVFIAVCQTHRCGGAERILANALPAARSAFGARLRCCAERTLHAAVHKKHFAPVCWFSAQHFAYYVLMVLYSPCCRGICCLHSPLPVRAVFGSNFCLDVKHYPRHCCHATVFLLPLRHHLLLFAVLLPDHTTRCARWDDWDTRSFHPLHRVSSAGTLPARVRPLLVRRDDDLLWFTLEADAGLDRRFFRCGKP